MRASERTKKGMVSDPPEGVMRAIVQREADQYRPATRTKTSDLKAIPSAQKSEWRKVSSVRSYKVILALNAVGGMLLTGAIARFATDQVMDASEVGFYWTTVTAILALSVHASTAAAGATPDS